ncbi:ciliary microtubule associated protein 1B [Cyanocitta cristata]
MSFRGRPDTPQETPGPASYQLPPVMGSGLVNKRSAPQYSLTGRGPSIFDYETRTPGPLNYNTVDTDVYMARAPPLHHGRAAPAPAGLHHPRAQRLHPAAGPETRTDLRRAPLGNGDPRDGPAPVGERGRA